MDESDVRLGLLDIVAQHTRRDMCAHAPSSCQPPRPRWTDRFRINTVWSCPECDRLFALRDYGETFIWEAVRGDR